jgi:hypothetical protein
VRVQTTSHISAANVAIRKPDSSRRSLTTIIEPVLPKDTVQLAPSSTKKKSRLIGSIGKFIAKVPKFLGHTAKFLGWTLLGGVGAALHVAAGSLGLAGMAGLGLAGGLEIRDGIREKDGIKVVSGTGEVVRGAFTGLLSVGQLMDLGQHTGTVAAATAGLGVLQGGLHLTSGVMKITEGRLKEVPRRRIEGMLEVGMGVASLAMVAGPLTPIAVGAYATLTAARYGVVNWERIQEGASKAKARTREFWNDMKADFRETDASNSSV